MYRYSPDFWFLCECYLGGLERLEQPTNLVHTEVLGKLKLQNLEKTDKNVNHHQLSLGIMASHLIVYVHIILTVIRTLAS